LVENQPLTQKIARTTGLGVETNCAGLRRLAAGAHRKWPVLLTESDHPGAVFRV